MSVYDNGKRERFIELRASGRSFAKIAEELGIDRKTAIRWGGELKADVAEAVKIHRDGLREKFRMAEEARLERLSFILAKLEKRLEGETFEGVSAERALRLFLEIETRLGREFDGSRCDPLSEMEKLSVMNF